MKGAFTLVEMLVVMAIIAILFAVGIPLLTDPSNNARKTAADQLRAHLQQARAHAIATGNTTSVLFPDYSADSKVGGSLIGIAEVGPPANSASGNTYEVTNLLQRWTQLPDNIYFLTQGIAKADHDTIMDRTEKIETEYQKRTINCNYVVFSPNGQITSPQNAAGTNNTIIAIALGKGFLQNGEVVPTQKTPDHRVVFDFLQVNRLSARARNFTPPGL